jgi:hypothetical protein
MTITGDVNGDGNDDFIVGALRSSTGASTGGAAYLFYGPITEDKTSAQADAAFIGIQPGGFVGRSVAMLGDIDGDTVSDFAFSAYKYDYYGKYNSGRVYVFFGQETLGYPGLYSGDINLEFDNSSSSAADILFDVNNGQSFFGSDVSSAGDFNGDGRNDILIGAERYDKHYEDGSGGCDPQVSSGCSNRDEGAAFVWSGTDLDYHRAFANFASGSIVNPLVSVFGDDDLDRLGYKVNAAGDVDGDSKGDILLGTPYADPSAKADAGVVYIISGDETGNVDFASATPMAKFVGASAGDQLGRAVGTGGDLDGDGDYEVILGAKGDDENGSNAGAAYLFLGPVSGTIGVGTADVIYYGEGAGDEVGTDSICVGDMAGGSSPDLLIGAHHTGSNNGSAYLVLGDGF